MITRIKANYNLLRGKQDELAAVIYADLFGYPLTVPEAKLWAIREIRQKNSQGKMQIAEKAVMRLKKIPSVEAVFLTGSAAVNNAKKNADADLMVITKINTLWLTRAAVFLYLKFIKKLKNPLCPNIFLDTNHLEIQQQNVYTAHEVLQAKCLFDRSNIQSRWLMENKWVKKYLPKAYKHINNQSNNPIPNNQISKFQLPKMLAIGFIELCAFLIQYLYMKSKITNETVGWGYAFFHSNNYSPKVLKTFKRRLLKYKNK